MGNPTDYREVFYQNYFQNQASRTGDKNIANKLREDHLHYKNEVLPLLPEDKNAKILEIGCGYGSLLKLLQDQGYSGTTGIDISEEQVKLAEGLGVKGISVTDISTFLNTCEERYDAVVGIDIIEHFTKLELIQLLDKLKNLLRPGGVMIFRTPNCDAPFGSTYHYGDITHEVFLNYSSAEQLMLSVGLDNVQILPSHIHVRGKIKEILRAMLWIDLVLISKLVLFASGKSTKNVILTPNLIMYGTVK